MNAEKNSVSKELWYMAFNQSARVLYLIYVINPYSEHFISCLVFVTNTVWSVKRLSIISFIFIQIAKKKKGPLKRRVITLLRGIFHRSRA